jgi:integrase/recombinase XerD
MEDESFIPGSSISRRQTDFSDPKFPKKVSEGPEVQLNRKVTIAEAVHEYTEEQVARGLKPETILGIRLYLDPLIGPEIGLDPDTPVEDVTRQDVVKYLQSRLAYSYANRDYKTSTKRNVIRQLRSLFKWIHAVGFTRSFILEGLIAPKPDLLIVIPLTDREIANVFNTINALSKHKLRNAAVVALMLDTGIRRTELANLRKSDLDLVDQTVKVFGKKRERVVGFGRRTAELLSLYAGHFSSRRPGAGKDHLFLTRMGEAMTPAAVAGIFGWLKEPTGIRRLNAHITRHTFATRFLQRGGDPFTLRILLGHSSLRMVATYVRTAEITDPSIMKNNSIVDESKSLGSILRNYTTSMVVQQTLITPAQTRNNPHRNLFVRGPEVKN